MSNENSIYIVSNDFFSFGEYMQTKQIMLSNEKGIYIESNDFFVE